MTRFLRPLCARLFARAIVIFTHLVTGVQARWDGCAPQPTQRIYFANHASHGDFVLIWTALPPALRRSARPVAGADYWQAGGLRRFIARDVFEAVLVDREGRGCGPDPIEPMARALGQGQSLILFPEGTRNTGDAPLLPFKSGLYRLARRHPKVDLVPVWLANLNRVLPKGEVLPVPLLCSVTFGAPLKLRAAESKEAFLTRAQAALRALTPAATEGAPS
ncbi:1-acyl-sn-glycerol-3-phosphate acyltransferase [Pelagibius sp.]|uniref:lysophospholipid acyltransferase family protein n=1 Tax=Pelagibius sp. TaxID=1931238 RepID=UPI002624321B|nr:lysophospholipid acyltransferase family protein [Pelagibius sp.]